VPLAPFYRQRLCDSNLRDLHTHRGTDCSGCVKSFKIRRDAADALGVGIDLTMDYG
jgi:hypothetical protein